MAFINFINVEGGGGGNPEAEAQLSARTAELSAVIDRTISGLTIPSGVTEIGEHAFDSCSALTEVTIHSGVTEIAANAFADNTSLATITFEGENPPTVAADAFSNLPMDVEIVTPEGADYDDIIEQVEESVMPYVVLTDPNGSAYTYTYKDGVIPYSAFNNWGSYKVEMNDGITEVGIAAFQNMSALSSLTLSTGITSIGNYAFQFDNNITGTISLPNIVTIGDGVFDGCSGITAVEFGENLTLIGDWAFINCTSLSALTFHNPSAPSIPGEALSGISNDTIWCVPTEHPDFNYNSWNDTINYFNNYYSVNWVLCDLSGNPYNPVKYAQFDDFGQMKDTPTWVVNCDEPPMENLSVMFSDEAVLIIQNGDTLFMPSIGDSLRIDRDGTAINATTDEADDGTLTDQYQPYIGWNPDEVDDVTYMRYDINSSLAEDYQYTDAGWSSNPESTDITGWLYDTEL